MPVRSTTSQQILQFRGVFDFGSRPRGFLQAVVVLSFHKVEAVAKFRFGVLTAFERLALAVEAHVPTRVVHTLDNRVVVFAETFFEETQPLSTVELERKKNKMAQLAR